MVPVVHTTWLNKEEETDGHSPMHFQCDDGNFYYLKYRTQIKKTEFDCLVYELVDFFTCIRCPGGKGSNGYAVQKCRWLIDRIWILMNIQNEMMKYKE